MSESGAESGTAGRGWTLGALCEKLRELGMQPVLEGDPQQRIRAVATLEDAGEGEITFLSNPKYEKLLATTRASAVVLRPDVEAPQRLARIRVEDPYAAITALIVAIHGYRRHRRPVPHATPPAIDPTARIGANATIHPGVTIEHDVVIGRDCKIGPLVHLPAGSRIADGSVVGPQQGVCA